MGILLDTVGCHGYVIYMGRRFKDLTGMRFGMLVVLGIAGTQDIGGKQRLLWRTRCDCGMLRTISGDRLKTGNVKSCGCWRVSRRLPVAQVAAKRFMGAYIRSARRHNRIFSLTKDLFVRLVFSTCSYCGAPPSLPIHASRSKDCVLVNGIDRIDSTKGYVEGNVATCCQTCNIAKHTMGLEKFRSWINTVYHNLNRRFPVVGAERIVSAAFQS